MKLLSIIFLLLAVTLSVIACILPNWSKNEITDTLNIDMSRHDGLWLKCEKYSSGNSKQPMIPIDDSSGITKCKAYGSAETPDPDGNLAAKILSIVGPAFLLVSTLLVGIDYKHSKLIGIVGIWALIAVVFVYPLIVLDHDITDEKKNPVCGMKDVTCNYGKLSTSYFLEIGAIVLAIIGLVIHTNKSSKHRRK
jgi:hypothetical protein